MKLSIIIVSYNTSKLTCQTLSSVFADLKNFPDLAAQTEVWLVDNNSLDNTLAEIELRFARQLVSGKSPTLHLIKNKKNEGFSAANNKAIAKSSGQIVLLLNSDTVVQNGALEKLVNAFAKQSNLQSAQLENTPQLMDNMGIISCSLWNPDHTLQPQGGSFPTLVSLAVHWLMLDDIPLVGRLLPSTQHTGRNARQFESSNSASIIASDWVGGTAMGLRKSMLDEIGLLDEDIFMYGEDVELCLRAKNHHWDVGILPAAKIIHLGSASSTSANAILGEIKGYIYIWSKHKPHWQMKIVKAILWTGCTMRFHLYSLLGKPTKRMIYHQALTDVLR